MLFSVVSIIYIIAISIYAWIHIFTIMNRVITNPILFISLIIFFIITILIMIIQLFCVELYDFEIFQILNIPCE